MYKVYKPRTHKQEKKEMKYTIKILVAYWATDSFVRKHCRKLEKGSMTPALHFTHGKPLVTCGVKLTVLNYTMDLFCVNC